MAKCDKCGQKVVNVVKNDKHEQKVVKVVNVVKSGKHEQKVVRG